MHTASENLFQVKNIKQLNFLSRFLKNMEYLYHGGEQTVSMDTTVPPGFLSNIPNMTR